MKRLVLSLLTLFLISICQNAEAGIFRCHRTGSCYNAVVARHVNDQVVVVNNLIGIPVPTSYSQPQAAQGATGYGYQTQTLNSVSDAYNSSVDMGVLWNQAARMADQAQQLAGSAATDFHALVQSEGSQRAEVAKIIAQGQAAAQALNAAKPQATAAQTITRSFSFKVSQGADGNYNVEKVADGVAPFDLITKKSASSVDFSTVIQNKCVECHNATRAEGKLNFLGVITPDQQEKVLKRITTTDVTLRMPKDRPPLELAEYKLFFRSMGK